MLNSGNTIMKKLDGVEMPSWKPTVTAAAWITAPVAVATPATIPSAMPCRTIMPPNASGFLTRRLAIPSFTSLVAA